MWRATLDELRALGAALWGWCSRAAGDTGMYRCIDNQALADLIAGRAADESAETVLQPSQEVAIGSTIEDGIFGIHIRCAEAGS
jgi:hypothetical protein